MFAFSRLRPKTNDLFALEASCSGVAGFGFENCDVQLRILVFKILLGAQTRKWHFSNCGWSSSSCSWLRLESEFQIFVSKTKDPDTMPARWRTVAPAVLDIYIYIYIYILIHLFIYFAGGYP